MPIYDFRCKKCGVVREASEAPKHCGRVMDRIYGFNVAWTNLPTRGGKSMGRKWKKDSEVQ